MTVSRELGMVDTARIDASTAEGASRQERRAGVVERGRARSTSRRRRCGRSRAGAETLTIEG